MVLVAVCFLLSLLLLLLLLLLLTTLVRIVSSRAPKKIPNIQLPPSPFKLPIVGNLHQLGSLPHRSLQALSRKHGPLMLLHLGRAPTLVVSSPEIAEEMLKTNDILFANRPYSYAANHLLNGGVDIAFAPYGEYWRQARKICALELFSSKRVESFTRVREEEIEDMIRKISQYSCSSVTEAAAAAAINLSDMLQSMSSKIILRATLGRIYRGGDGDYRLENLTKESEELRGGFYAADYFPWLEFIDVVTGSKKRLERNFRGWNVLLEQVVKGSLKSIDGEGDHTNLSTVLLRLQKDCADEAQLTDENIKAIIMDILTGGTDTTATTLLWAMAELIRNPRVMQKAQAEVRRVVGRRSKVDEDDIEQMENLKSVIKEAMRLHPPLSLLVPHESSATTTLGGCHVPPKTKVIINAWAIGRDPKSWENAEEFLPERFIGDPITDYKGKDFRLIPFGSGRRGCPGMTFAIPIIELALANLLYWFDWKMPGDKMGTDLDLTEASGLTVHMKVPLQLVAINHLA